MVAYLGFRAKICDPGLLVARAEGMSKVARKAKVGRENLYRAFAPGGNPTMATVMRVLDALGLTIRVSPAIAG